MRRWIPLTEHPFELFFGLLAAVAGPPLLVGVSAPTSINALLPEVVVRAWGGTLTLAGVCIITGILVRHARPNLLLFGLRVERAGLTPLAAAATVYAVAALGYAGTRALLPVAIDVALAAACVARAYAVAKLEKAIRTHSGGRHGD